MNIFDIIGPVMIGPSSSHTAGAVRLGRVANKLIDNRPIRQVEITLSGSFAQTYKGHGTDRALLAGIMGYHSYSPEIRDALMIADQREIRYEFLKADIKGAHPNTARIHFTLRDGEEGEVLGASVGGGNILVSQVNGMTVELTGENNTILVMHQDTPGVIAAVTQLMHFEYEELNIANFHLSRRGKSVLKYESIQELVTEAERREMRISELVMKDQAEAMERSELEIYEKMEVDFQVMVASVEAGQRKEQRSMSGLTGGEGWKMKTYAEAGGSLCGSFLAGAISRALAVAGCNASMGRIVAAPTAGSCGILPGCLVSLWEEKRCPEKEIIRSMFTAGAFGMVIAKRASIAGAQGGCQAECGSAAAMAAAALVELMGGTPAQCADACAIAIANQLGLVCDPVAGLVEIPCIKRNVSGLVIAFSSADLALAGIEARIPADECLDAMRNVGDAMPEAVKETAMGGLASTPTGRRLQKQVFGDQP